MKEVKKLSNPDIFWRARDIVRIGNEAVAKAKEENKRYGIPDFFCKNGIVYYVLESGEVTTTRPKILEGKK